MRRHTWLPSVIASTPAASSRSASLGVMPDAVRDVLAVRDAEVDLELLEQRRQALLDRLTTRGADDVGDEQDAQLVP